MSLTHMDPAEASSREPDFARTPPQDLVAEQSVLGGMMLSKDAIADCVEVLRGNDFYRPAHESIYEAICDLYARGEPADAVTVSDELTKRKEISRVGGPAYLHTLISSVPTAANAGFYAEIVRERSVLRRLVDAGTKIVQLGYGNDGEVDDIVNAAQAEIYAVSERRTTEDYVALKDVIEGTVDEIEASGHRGTEMAGVPTGFYELDDLTHGLHPGQMIVIAARPAIGKALALDTPIPTPTGWTTMGEIQPGEQVLAADGTATDVVAATEVMVDRPCYQVTFDDGTTLIADEQHQWLTDTRASRKSAQAAAAGYNRSKNQQTFASVKTTGEIAATLRCPTKDARLYHSVRTAEALELPETELPIGPYTLGAWLGDGHSKAARVTNEDDEVMMRIAGEGYRLKPVAGITWALSLEQEYLFDGEETADADASFEAILRRESLLGNKHIPTIYLRASVKQRRELLAGLLDTDGTVTNAGCVQFSVTHRRLAEDTRELIHSLGYRTGWSEKPVHGRNEASSTAFTITFSTEDDVFGLHRKKVLHKERACKATPKRTSRFIKSIERIKSVPVRCIEVAHSSHLYLAGKSFVPTHNSTLALDFARSAAIKHSLTTVIFSLEMSRNEIATKLLAAEATINLQDLRKGTIRDEQWSKIATTMGRMNDAPLFIDDSPNMSLMEIRAKCRRLKQRHDLKLVIIDYLQLMSSGKRVESRQQEVSEFSRALKLLAKELGVPVIALSQLNRGSEQRPDKKPLVSDLRESGCLTGGTRILRSDTGAETTMQELFDTGARDVPVWSLDDSLRYVERHLTHVFSTGTKPVYRLTLTSGKTVRATSNHPLHSYEGWRALGDLQPGDRVAVPRHINGPAQRSCWDDGVVQTVAAMVVEEAKIPENVFALPKVQIALFLRKLWAAGGVIDLDRSTGNGSIRYSAAKRDLLDALSLLMLRFGISSDVRPVLSRTDECRFVLEIRGVDDQRRFLQEIEAHGHRSAISAELLRIVRTQNDQDRDADMPPQVAEGLQLLLSGPEQAGPGLVKSSPGLRHTDDPERGERLAGVVDVLNAAEMDFLAVNDVMWDEIASIEPDGEEEVFDATVLGNHNFIANGIAVHNSIEQDADMVMLLHREDVYDKESARAGEADVIVAKHRNGPTKTIVVGFQGHYSRFSNMAMEQ